MNKIQDIFLDMNADNLSRITRRVETDRFGPFVFQLGLGEAEILALLARVDDAQHFLKSSPLSQVANRLEKEVLVSSIHGTDTIEGGQLTVEETARALELDPAHLQAEQERRVTNIKRAYDLAHGIANDANWRPDIAYICRLHAAITEGLGSVEARNVPGVLRDNPRGVVTYVGSSETGERYKPPQYGGDIEKLLTALTEWHAELADQGVPPLVRAPLLHLYFELIHPFWDGNGRVGRVLEASVLLAAGYRYAPFAMARYYLDEIRQYFALFNACRRDAGKKLPAPNMPFVSFHLNGMLTTIKRLHERVNRIVEMLLFETTVKRMADNKEINARQYAIVSTALNAGAPLALDALRQAPWYRGLYLKLSEKTKQRDMADVEKKGLIHVDDKGRLWPGFLISGNS